MKITIIGSGNVAWHLARELHKVGHNIVQVFSRTFENARKLADSVSAEAVSEFSRILSQADMYLLSVTDTALSELSLNKTLAEAVGKKLVVHTAGSLPAKLLRPLSVNYGVIYPLQTFTKNKEVDFTGIPLCLEASSENNLKQLRELAESISNDVRPMSFEQRKYLHPAAVFACNYVNRMLVSANRILNKQNPDFNILKPLVYETVEKAFELLPEEAQTGPAKRNDKQVMQNHLRLLADFPEEQKIYSFVARLITEQYHSDMDNFKERLKDITTFIFDVDGVFSDLITLDESGELLRSMNVKDGYSVMAALKAGFKIGIITGGNSESVRKRFERLGVTEVYLASKDKMVDYNDFCRKYNVSPKEILYMGDDVPDYYAMKASALATCPADASEEIQNISHYISDKRSSQGCVRDVIEQVMRAQGKWFKPE